MPNYCRKCCQEKGIDFNLYGKTCWYGMKCDGCGKVIVPNIKDGEDKK